MRRIPRLTLSPEEQYNAWAAIWAVQNSSEVQTAMHDLHIRRPNHAMSMILVRPADGLPHLPNVVTDATVDQVLDIIVKTFRGTILYETCAPPDQYDIDFAGAGRGRYASMDGRGVGDCSSWAKAGGGPQEVIALSGHSRRAVSFG
ncbi:MAG TPA: hypothetical protein VNO32_21130 [Candidatus Acidoferrum sp.]|nr:hypothetical protein [Candidatus Acidoferrum sp.]